MQIQVLLIIACVATIVAGTSEASFSENYDAHPNYNFKYSVNDRITGDVKSQTETRDGDNVQGQYSLNEADGYKRIVDYTSDAVNGLKVTVRRERLHNVAAEPHTEKEVVANHGILIRSNHKMITPKATATTVVHHQQPAVYHHTPQTVHFLHSSPSTHHDAPVIVHRSPTVVHQTSDAVVHHTPAFLKTSLSAPHHIAYVHYH